MLGGWGSGFPARFPEAATGSGPGLSIILIPGDLLSQMKARSFHIMSYIMLYYHVHQRLPNLRQQGIRLFQQHQPVLNGSVEINSLAAFSCGSFIFGKTRW